MAVGKDANSCVLPCCPVVNWVRTWFTQRDGCAGQFLGSVPEHLAAANVGYIEAAVECLHLAE